MIRHQTLHYPTIFVFLCKKVCADVQPHLQVCIHICWMKCFGSKDAARKGWKLCKRENQSEGMKSIRGYRPCRKWIPNPGSQKEKWKQTNGKGWQMRLDKCKGSLIFGSFITTTAYSFHTYPTEVLCFSLRNTLFYFLIY